MRVEPISKQARAQNSKWGVRPSPYKLQSDTGCLTTAEKGFPKLRPNKNFPRHTLMGKCVHCNEADSVAGGWRGPAVVFLTSLVNRD